VAEPWTPEVRAKKRQYILNFNRGLIRTLREMGERQSKRQSDAQLIARVRTKREAIFRKFAERHGAELAARWGELFDEVMDELARQAEN